MQFLNLGNYSLLNTITGMLNFKTSTFPGGEEFIQITRPLEIGPHLTILWKARSSSDVMKLLMAVDASRRMGFTNINLCCPYFPYARQDRVMADGQSLSVAVMAKLINGLFFDMVTILDPHSDVTSALIDEVNVIPNNWFVDSVLQQIPKDVVLIAPDLGAAKKVRNLCISLELENQVVQCDKIRDLKTNAITGTKIYGDVKGKDCLVVDDICDFGRTFIELGKVLKDNECNNLYLAVSHGLFGGGFETLGLYYERIFTTDSFWDRKQTHPTLTCFNLFE